MWLGTDSTGVYSTHSSFPDYDTDLFARCVCVCEEGIVRMSGNYITAITVWSRGDNETREGKNIHSSSADWSWPLYGRWLSLHVLISHESRDKQIRYISILVPRNTAVMTFHRLSGQKVAQAKAEPGIYQNKSSTNINNMLKHPC